MAKSQVQWPAVVLAVIVTFSVGQEWLTTRSLRPGAIIECVGLLIYFVGAIVWLIRWRKQLP
jgi:hypothetical protein